jgi:sugar phosphate permease
MVMASLGAMCGQMPLAYLVNLAGWRKSLFILAAVGMILSILSFALIEDRVGKKSFTRRNFYAIIQELLLILKKKQTWFIAIFAFAIWSPITGFASLWGVPFIEKAYSMSVEKAAFSCSLIWIGVALGSLFFGWWSEKTRKRNLPLRFGSILGVVSSILVIYFSVNHFLLNILLICFGIAAGGQALIFAVMKDVTDKHLIGTGIGLINMAVVASGFVFQPVIGILLKILHPVHENVEHVSYTLGDYRIALVVIPLIFLISLLVSLFFIKETYRSIYRFK